MSGGLNFDVFISYRRDGGEILGRLIYEMLKDNYDIFFDHESLSSGRFDTKLLNIIIGCRDVIVVLSKGCLERCNNEDDWFRREINCALDNKKNIILLMTEDFRMPEGAEINNYPEEIGRLLRYNGHRLNIAYLDGVMAKVCNDFITKKKESASPFDSLSEWRTFAACLEDKRFAEFLPENIKRDIIRNSISSFLGEYNGRILNSLVDVVAAQEYNVRPKFRYEIDLDLGFSFRYVDIDTDKYYVLSESLSYSKKFLCGAPDKSFWMAFVTNLDELDVALRDENFFFSENLMMYREDIRDLGALSDEEKRAFYLYCMRAKININGSIPEPVEVRIDESGIFAKYEIDDDILAASSTFDVKIRFRIPQKKGGTYFFASISEPTYSPFVRFSYPEDVFEVKMIPFLNRSVTAKDTKIFDGLRELSIENEWVIPVSGAVFVIADQ